jgi:hypothetical protein
MHKYLDVQSFRQLARDGGAPHAPIARESVSFVPMIDEGTRTVRFCFSDGSVDRYGDTIAPDGWTSGPSTRTRSPCSPTTVLPRRSAVPATSASRMPG